MNRRFDNRTVDTFKKDIYFGTMLEKYFFNRWLDVAKSTNGINISSWSDNGCGNDGRFIASGNTAGADYRISGLLCDREISNEPLEVKWVPTAGKFTLKENDLKAYIRESANILFIYNSINCGTNLRKPNDYNLDEHIKLIESKSNQIKWGIMWTDKVKEFYDYVKVNNLFKPISYMGYKPGIVLKQNDFSKWFTEYKWNN